MLTKTKKGLHEEKYSKKAKGNSLKSSKTLKTLLYFAIQTQNLAVLLK